MAKQVDVLDVLNSTVTGSETVELMGSLLTFTLAMLGVNERVKAGFDLFKAVAKVYATKADESQNKVAQYQTPAGISASARKIGEEPLLIEVNLRQVLNALSILTIEMSHSGFLKLLEGSVLVGDQYAICATGSHYASHPENWSSVDWIHTMLAGGSFSEENHAGESSVRLKLPNVTTGATGRLGVELCGVLAQDSNPGASGPVLAKSSATVGSKKLVEPKSLNVVVQGENDLRPELRDRGIRLKGKRKLTGFRIVFAQEEEKTPLFSVFLVSGGSKKWTA